MRRLRKYAVVLCLLSLLGACAVDDSADAGPDARPGDAGADGGVDATDATTATPLVDHGAWMVAGAADDPFADRPEAPACDSAAGVGLEELNGEPAVKVKTGDCAYVTLVQSTLVDLAADQPVTARGWHFELTGPDGGEAHVAVQIGDDVVLDYRTAIPADSSLMMNRALTSQAYPAGTPVYFHVHNHGANEYYLIELAR